MPMNENRSQRPAATHRRARGKMLSVCAAPIVALLLGVSSRAGAGAPEPTRALRDLNTSSFPFTPVKNGAEWKLRHEEIQRRVLLAAGL